MQCQTSQIKTRKLARKNKKYAPCWLFLATIASRKTRGIFAWELLFERTYETMRPLVDTVFSLLPNVHQFYSDGFTTYRELVYRQVRRAARHDVAPGKEQTYTVEGTNADLRCYLLRANPGPQRTLFSRHVEKLRSIVRLFITCYNHCCLARLKYQTARQTLPSFYPNSFRHSFMRKLLHLVFGILKTGLPFNVEHALST